MGPSDDRRSLQWGWGCCGRQGNVIRRPSCPCIRCCRGGPLRVRAVERESPRDRHSGRSSGAGATSTATVLSRQETPANRHSTREARRPSECSSEAGPAVARVSIAAGAGTSAMTAEPCWKPKIRGAAWRRSCGTGSAAREEQGTAVGSAVLLLHGLQATATGSPRSMRHWQTPARKLVWGSWVVCWLRYCSAQ